MSRRECGWSLHIRPVAIEDVPLASEAAAPPDDPPGVNFRFHGLRVTPQRRDHVYPAQENSEWQSAHEQYRQP